MELLKWDNKNKNGQKENDQKAGQTMAEIVTGFKATGI
jgi:hypothetical protein